MRTLLHVGCGNEPLPDWLEGFTETRLDINPAVSPDIIASMLDLGEIGQYDAVYCRHALEHLFPHEVTIALNEFHRVLKVGGHLMVFVPDLEGVKATDEALFQSPAGPISGLDLIYGFRQALESNPYMAHKTGFVQGSLTKALSMFSKANVRRLGNYDMIGAAIK